METHPLQAFYDKLEEPTRGTLLYLRELILEMHPNMNESLKYQLPFFCVGKKMFCYFWFDKKNKHQPYVSFADGHLFEHPMLESGDRKRFKIFRIDPNEDIPIASLKEVITTALTFHK